ncbi:hypothetical protein BC628DRAFT_1498042, partial [Trametes gibbosa]
MYEAIRAAEDMLCGSGRDPQREKRESARRGCGLIWAGRGRKGGGGARRTEGCHPNRRGQNLAQDRLWGSLSASAHVCDSRPLPHFPRHVPPTMSRPLPAPAVPLLPSPSLSSPAPAPAAPAQGLGPAAVQLREACPTSTPPMASSSSASSSPPLFGVTMLQVFVYFQQYPADRAWRKLAVCWLWTLDALHLALSAHFVYHYLVTNYDKPDALSEIVWSFKLRVVVGAFVVCSVHTLYTSRLWTLLAIDDHVEPFGKEARRWSRQKTPAHASASRWVMRRVVPWLVSALVGLGYGIAIVLCTETYKVKSFGDLAHATWATFVPLGASTVIDAVIAGSLCYFLARCRPRSEAMNGPFKTLIVYTLNTGTITGQALFRLFSLLAIAMMVAYPGTFIPIAIEFIVIKLYINSYMAMLNARSVMTPSPDHAHHAHGSSFLPSGTGARILSYPLTEQKRAFPSFYTSLSSLQLGSGAGFSSRLSNPAVLPRHAGDGRNTHAPTADSDDAAAEWTCPRPSPVPRLRAPRVNHPDVCPEYGTVETVVGVGVTFPAAVFDRTLQAKQQPTSEQAPRFHSFTSASSSATVAPASAHPLAPAPISERYSAYADPVDPLTPIPLRVTVVHASTAEADITAAPSSTEELEFPSPPDRALSPLRFASYSSGTSSPGPGNSLSAPSTPTRPNSYVRPGRPRLPSAYSIWSDAGACEGEDEGEGEAGDVPRPIANTSAASGSGSSSIPTSPTSPTFPGSAVYGSPGGRRYTHMVSAARESRRALGSFQSGCSSLGGGG